MNGQRIEDLINYLTKYLTLLVSNVGPSVYLFVLTRWQKKIWRTINIHVEDFSDDTREMLRKMNQHIDDMQINYRWRRKQDHKTTNFMIKITKKKLFYGLKFLYTNYFKINIQYSSFKFCFNWKKNVVNFLFFFVSLFY